MDFVVKPKVIRIKGNESNLQIKELPFSRGSLNDGDAFVLDHGDMVHLWNGKYASQCEISRAQTLANEIVKSRKLDKKTLLRVDSCYEAPGSRKSWLSQKSLSLSSISKQYFSQSSLNSSSSFVESSGSVDAVSMEDSISAGDSAGDEEFVLELLPDTRKYFFGLFEKKQKIKTAEKAGSDEKLPQRTKKLYHVVSESNGLRFKLLNKKKKQQNLGVRFSSRLLDSSEAFIVDDGLEICFWVGRRSPLRQSKTMLTVIENVYKLKFVIPNKRPVDVKFTVVNHGSETKFPIFGQHFNLGQKGQEEKLQVRNGVLTDSSRIMVEDL